MTNTPPEFTAAAKAQLDTAIRFATVTTESAQRLFELNLKTVRTSFDEASAQIRALASAKDPADIQALAGKVLKPGLDKSQAYAKEVYESVAGAQAEVAALVEQQVTEFQKQMVVALDGLMKNAPAGSEAFVSSVKSAASTANQAYETAMQSWRGVTASFEPAAPAPGKRKAA
jgi:phasin family protein